MFVNFQQFLVSYSLCVKSLLSIRSIRTLLFFFILSIFSRSYQDNKALDPTLIFIIDSSRTRLHRGIIKQNSKLDHAINFILLDQDIAKRIELRKTVKIGVMVIRYRGTSPKIGSCQGECPYPMLSSSLLVDKMEMMMDSHTSSVRGPPACG